MDTTGTPEALELVIRGQEHVVGYVCRKCGTTFILSKRDLAEPKFKEEKQREAKYHCDRRKCSRCSKPTSFNFLLHCDDCREEVAFEKAEKVSLEEYDSDYPVFWETFGPNDGYFANMEELVEYCEETEQDLPDWVWASEKMEFELPDADTLLEAQVNEFYEGAFDHISEDAKNHLDEYMRVWAKEQNIVAWKRSRSRVVVIREA